MTWNVWLGNALILVGIVAIILGVIGVLRFKPFTMKVLASAKIDTVAYVFILLGVVARSGIGWFSAKVLLILLIVLFANPIISSQTVSRARQDGEL
jgi:multicomponent Na+:H+ antiporter subunit G